MEVRASFEEGMRQSPRRDERVLLKGVVGVYMQ